MAEQSANLLRALSEFAGEGAELYAAFFDRRALRNERQGTRHEARPRCLRAIRENPTDRRQRAASILISPDYERLEMTFRDAELRRVKAFGSPDFSTPLPRLVASSPNGATVVTTGPSNTLRLWSTETGEPTVPPLTVGVIPHVTAFSPDGTMLVVGQRRGVAQIWDTRAGKPIGTELKYGKAVYAAAFSPDSRRAAIAGEGGQGRMDPRTGQTIGSPLEHGEAVLAMAFSPDGRKLVTGGRTEARLWDLERGSTIGKPMKHDDWVSELDFSPDGRTLITGSGSLFLTLANEETTDVVRSGRQGSARLWRTDTADPKGVTLPPLKVGNNGNGIFAVAFSPDGKNAMAGGSDGIAYRLDGETVHLSGRCRWVVGSWPRPGARMAGWPASVAVPRCNYGISRAANSSGSP